MKMKTVRFHRYALPTGTEIFADPYSDESKLIPANSWIGIIHEDDGWYHVVTAETDGWIRTEDCMEGKHIRLSPVLTQQSQQYNYSLRA